MASATASTTPTSPAAARDAGALTPPVPAAEAAPRADAAGQGSAEHAAAPHTGSLSRRMLLIAAGWITILLLVGGVALNRTLTDLLERQFDEQLNYTITSMITSAEIDPYGDVWFNRQLADQRYHEPTSGFYWQVSGKGHDDYISRSLTCP